MKSHWLSVLHAEVRRRVHIEGRERIEASTDEDRLFFNRRVGPPTAGGADSNSNAGSLSRSRCK